MSCAVMNVTEAGASVTGWSRSDAPNTIPASIAISSSIERSRREVWAPATDGNSAAISENARAQPHRAAAGRSERAPAAGVQRVIAAPG
jgi:hypothetical protein